MSASSSMAGGSGSDGLLEANGGESAFLSLLRFEPAMARTDHRESTGGWREVEKVPGAEEESAGTAGLEEEWEERREQRRECRTDRPERPGLCQIGQVLSFARLAILAHVTDASGERAGRRAPADGHALVSQSQARHPPSSATI